MLSPLEPSKLALSLCSHLIAACLTGLFHLLLDQGNGPGASLPRRDPPRPLLVQRMRSE